MLSREFPMLGSPADCTRKPAAQLAAQVLEFTPSYWLLSQFGLSASIHVPFRDAIPGHIQLKMKVCVCAGTCQSYIPVRKSLFRTYRRYRGITSATPKHRFRACLGSSFLHVNNTGRPYEFTSVKRFRIKPSSESQDQCPNLLDQSSLEVLASGLAWNGSSASRSG